MDTTSLGLGKVKVPSGESSASLVAETAIQKHRAKEKAKDKEFAEALVKHEVPADVRKDMLVAALRRSDPSMDPAMAMKIAKNLLGQIESVNSPKTAEEVKEEQPKLGVVLDTKL